MFLAKMVQQDRFCDRYDLADIIDVKQAFLNFLFDSWEMTVHIKVRILRTPHGLFRKQGCAPRVEADRKAEKFLSGSEVFPGSESPVVNPAETAVNGVVRMIRCKDNVHAGVWGDDIRLGIGARLLHDEFLTAPETPDIGF